MGKAWGKPPESVGTERRGPGDLASAAYRALLRCGELARMNRAPMACWLQPTTLSVAALQAPAAKASQAATHCQAEAAISPSPSTRFGLRRGPGQRCQAASSGASMRRHPCSPSHSSSSAEPAGSCWRMAWAAWPRPRLDRYVCASVRALEFNPRRCGRVQGQATHPAPALETQA